MLPISAQVLVGRMVVMYKVNREIQKAISSDTVIVSGGKLSAKNPLTFTLGKQGKEWPSE